MKEYVYKFDKNFVNVSLLEIKELEDGLLLNAACESVTVISNITCRFRSFVAGQNPNEYNLEADQSSNLCRIQTSSPRNLAMKIFLQLIFKSSIKCPLRSVSFILIWKNISTAFSIFIGLQFEVEKCKIYPQFVPTYDGFQKES